VTALTAATSGVRAAGLSLGATAIAVAAPVLASVGPARRRLAPRLAGISDAPHLALTYDDGPDPVSTPLFLDLLERHGRLATFFLLGEHVARHPALVAEMAARGHELAVHGWDHTCVLLKSPAVLAGEIQETVEVIARVTGRRAAWYRPPYGILSTPALVAARALELTLTSRSRDSNGGGIPMCGVPCHAVDGYIARLVKKGVRVAICDQVEDPRRPRGS